MSRPHVAAGRVGQLVRTVAVEAAWWIVGAGRLWWRYTVRASAHLLAVVGLWVYGQQLVAVALVAPVAGIASWARWWPWSYRRRLADPLARYRIRRGLRRSWPVVMESVGLARRTPATARPTRKPGADPVQAVELVQVPTLTKLRWVGGELHATPRLLTGQTVDDVENVADRLRVVVDAERCRIVPNVAATACRIVWGFGDPLR